MVPTSSAKSHTITRNTEATDTLFVTRKISNGLGLDGIPNTHLAIIITGKQVTTRLREGDRGNTTQNLLIVTASHLTARTNREETASSIIRSGTNKVTVGEESDRVDIRLMTTEGLLALARVDVPDLDLGVTGTGDKVVFIGGQSQAKEKGREEEVGEGGGGGGRER